MSSTKNSTKTIFLAEDEPAIAEVITFLLDDAGYTVVYAKDGDEAVALLDAHTPDLFLLDVMMPGRDGFAVAREIRSRPVLAKADIVFLSALGDDISRRKGYADGAEQYIVKPFDNNELLRRIAELVN